MTGKKVGVFGFLLAVCMLFHAPVYAATAKVTYRDGGCFTYGEDTLSMKDFAGMAPGDERTKKISLQNDSTKPVTFYVSQQTLDNLEEDHKAAGAAYRYCLTMSDGKESKKLLCTGAGGYGKDKTADAKGLLEVDQLRDYVYLAKVPAGNRITLCLTLKLEGEGNDNHEDRDYTNASGHLKLTFCALDEKGKITYTDPEEQSVSHPVRDFFPGPVKTGDETGFILFILLFLLGLGMTAGAYLRHRKSC